MYHLLLGVGVLCCPRLEKAAAYFIAYKRPYCELCTLSRRIPFNYLLVNLAAADISYAIFAVPNIILSHHVYHPEGLAGTLLCTTLTGRNLGWLGGRASMITLLVIAIERYFAVVHPLGNKGKLTNRKLKVCNIQLYHYDCHCLVNDR